MELKNLSKIPQQFRQDLHQFSELCQQKLGRNLISIILFGSVARGKYTSRSDLDFCVVTKKIDEKRKFEIMYQFNRNCDIVLRREKDFAAYLANLSAIDLEIANEGVVIYGKEVLGKSKQLLKKVKQQYQLIYHGELGKGVWEIGTAS